MIQFVELSDRVFRCEMARTPQGTNLLTVSVEAGAPLSREEARRLSKFIVAILRQKGLRLRRSWVEKVEEKR